MQEKAERKLTAILYADVAGYSRLTGQDEEGTHQILSTFLDAITEQVQKHKGQVLHFAGDAVLAEFASVVNAVTCADTIQRDLSARNQDVAEECRLKFRIGINLGDVIVDRQEIYGDGVNVAARLESLAEPGGICISRPVLDQVRNKLELGYASLGEQKVKNIAEPVAAYRVITNPRVPGGVVGEARAWFGRTPWVLAFTFFVVAGISALATWNGYFDSDKPDHLALPAKPSIAVLPFRNLSGDAGEDYFSDGITEDIITDLSKFQDLFVIASNTVFTYKGKHVNVQDVADELGVRYVLEGSVQKSDEKVRINAQLIDGGTGHHVWADRLVRDLEDLFALQDEIVGAIVGTLAVQVDRVERDRAMRKDTADLQAYDLLLRGREHHSRVTDAANSEARRLFRQAIELDPNYASAYVDLGRSYLQMVRFGWTASPSEALQKAHDLAQEALNLEESHDAAHRLLGWTYLKWQQYDLAADQVKRALELNPNNADGYDLLGAVTLYSGQPESALEAIKTAIRFNPNVPVNSAVHLALGYYLTGRYDEVITTIEQSLDKNPGLVVHYVILAAAYAQAGYSEEAGRAVAQVRRLHPFFEVDSFGSAFRDSADRARLAEGLRNAGLE